MGLKPLDEGIPFGQGKPQVMRDNGLVRKTAFGKIVQRHLSFRPFKQVFSEEVGCLSIDCKNLIGLSSLGRILALFEGGKPNPRAVCELTEGVREGQPLHLY